MSAEAGPAAEPLRRIDAAGVELAFEDRGAGPPVVLLHGLTATRRYVVMGSRALERGGHRVIAVDARGHGDSAPAPRPEAYAYTDLVADLLALLDGLGLERATLAGASMGAHTAAAFALAHPDRVRALALITPAADPDAPRDAAALARWDALARGLRTGGVEGFMDAYGEPSVGERGENWRDTVLTVVRQRLARHANPDAVADALAVVPRSQPFDALADLGAITAPAVIVGSRDAADPDHPLATARRWAAEIDGASLAVEDEGRSPLAWQGAQLSKVIAAVADVR